MGWLNRTLIEWFNETTKILPNITLTGQLYKFAENSNDKLAEWKIDRMAK